MKKNLLIIFAVLLISSCAQNKITSLIKTPVTSAPLTSSEFVKGSEDIPLVDGLELTENNSVNFDSPSGSFATVPYKSAIDLEKIRSFYLKTLPHMGWRLTKNAQDSSSFIRDNEKLEIQFVSSEGHDGKIVKFLLSSTTK